MHFDATPVAPPGSEMLMHQKPARRSSFGPNFKKAWYLGQCLNHYRTFRDILLSTGAERLSDTIKFQHHAIGIPEITPADRILEAARRLNEAIRRLAKEALMDTLEAIQVLREVMLGETVKPVEIQPERVARVAPQRVAASPKTITKTWYRIDHNAKAFITTKTGGPQWSKVSRCVTLYLTSGNIIQDLKVNRATSEKLLHRPLPKGTSGMCTILYHADESVTNMEVPSM